MTEPAAKASQSGGPRFREASPERGLIAAIMTGPEIAQASDVVVFVHGITANAHTWPLIISRLPNDVATISVDLRGRGDSADLPGPWGMKTHADDLARLLDDLGVDRQILMVGHSMGAFVTSTFATTYPERIRGAVLVDGGPKLVDSEGIDPDTLLAAVLGPALERLSVTYRSRDDYRLFWQAHPALASTAWTDFLEAYINHDLGGVEPKLRSRVVAEAVQQDGAEIFIESGVTRAIEAISCPTELLLAARGLLDQPEPLIAPEVANRAASANDNLRVTAIPVVNHYTIVMSPEGADAVAAAIRRQL